MNIDIKIPKEEFKKKLGIKDGKPGKTPTKQELTDLIKPLIPKVEHGKTPIKGIDYDDGKDGSPDTPDQVVEKVNASEKKIKAKQIEGLTKLMNVVEDYGKNPTGGGGASLVLRANGTRISEHVTELNFTTNLTGTYAGNGVVNLAASGGGSLLSIVDVEGGKNGSNTAFTLPQEPTNGVLMIVLGQSILFENVHFTRSGVNLTYLFTPADDLSDAIHKAILY